MGAVCVCMWKPRHFPVNTPILRFDKRSATCVLDGRGRPPMWFFQRGWGGGSGTAEICEWR